MSKSLIIEIAGGKTFFENHADVIECLLMVSPDYYHRKLRQIQKILKREEKKQASYEGCLRISELMLRKFLIDEHFFDYLRLYIEYLKIFEDNVKLLEAPKNISASLPLLLPLVVKAKILPFKK